MKTMVCKFACQNLTFFQKRRGNCEDCVKKKRQLVKNDEKLVKTEKKMTRLQMLKFQRLSIL